jgi:hypothetical protein
MQRLIFFSCQLNKTKIMRNLLFFLPITCIVLFACSPEGSKEIKRVRPEDPKAISSNIKIWHGVRKTGNPPAASTNPNSPVLDQQSNNQTVVALAGKYAVIQPEVVSGDVKGYYVRVNGAADYFNVDYTTTRNIGGRFARQPSPKKKALARGMGIDSTGGGGALDSAIVIVIPSTIQPGQFCVTYWAYDPAGNVSNPITVCITVSSFGGDAGSAYLAANWHITASSDDTLNNGWDPVYGYADTSWSVGTCINNHIVDSLSSGSLVYPQYISSVLRADLLFSANGALRYDLSEQEKVLNYATSTCSNFVFTSQTDNEFVEGAWSHNSTTNKLVIIFDFDDTGAVDPEAYEYDLIKINNNKIYLHDLYDDSWLKLEK